MRHLTHAVTHIHYLESRLAQAEDANRKAHSDLAAMREREANLRMDCEGLRLDRDTLFNRVDAAERQLTEAKATIESYLADRVAEQPEGD